MRKLFIKCSDERSRRFSIITTIARTDEGKRVFKEACYEEGREHLSRVASYAEMLEKAYAPAKACPVEFDGEKLTFAYLEGESLEQMLRDAVRRGDTECVKDLFIRQKSILTACPDNETEFVPSDEFEKVFGEAEPYVGLPGFRISNFDGIAGNIIFEGDDVYFIDYEWVMTFVMPRDLVLYHCLRDAYYHISGLEELLPLKDALRLLGIKMDMHVMQRSYEHFFEYVITEPDGTSFAVAKHSSLKDHTDLADLRKPAIPAGAMGDTAYDMWRECDRAVAVLQGRIGKLEAELADVRAKYARLDDEWFRRYDDVRNELVTNRDAYAAEKAHMEYSYKAMETDRDTWKRMFEDVTGSKSYKALQTVKGIGRKKG
jgi:hypothetical protein